MKKNSIIILFVPDWNSYLRTNGMDLIIPSRPSVISKKIGDKDEASFDTPFMLKV
jgi:hypothetical protein